jgi:hypothetical protein
LFPRNSDQHAENNPDAAAVTAATDSSSTAIAVRNRATADAIAPPSASTALASGRTPQQLEVWRKWLTNNYLPLNHELAPPNFAAAFRAPVFDPLDKFGWSSQHRCYYTKSGAGKRYYHGLRNVLQRTFYPTRSRQAIRMAVKAKNDVQRQLGIPKLTLPTPPWAAGVTAVSLLSAQSGIQAGTEVDRQISDVINLFNDASEMPMKYTYYKFTTNPCYQDTIVKFLTETTPEAAREMMEAKLRENWARLFPQLGPIVQFWFAETSRRRIRPIQAQVPVYHSEIRLATQIDVVAFDFNKKQLIVIDNKNSRSKYFKTGAQKMLPPYEQHDDSDYNLAQLQVKFSAWLFELTYKVQVQSTRIFRTQLGEFEEFELEPWVHQNFQQAIDRLVTTMRDMYRIRRFDEEAGPMASITAGEGGRRVASEDEYDANDPAAAGEFAADGEDQDVDDEDEDASFEARHSMTQLRDETLPSNRGRGRRVGNSSSRGARGNGGSSSDRGRRGGGGGGPIHRVGRVRTAADLVRLGPLAGRGGIRAMSEE